MLSGQKLGGLGRDGHLATDLGALDIEAQLLGLGWDLEIEVVTLACLVEDRSGDAAFGVFVVSDQPHEPFERHFIGLALVQYCEQHLDGATRLLLLHFEE